MTPHNLNTLKNTPQARSAYFRGLRAGLLIALALTSFLAFVIYKMDQHIADEATATSYYYQLSQK